VRGTSEELDIQGEDLQPNKMYTVIVDGFTLAVVMTDGSGKFELSLSTDSGNLPPQVRPVSNISHVDVRDSMGQPVLGGGPPI